MGKYNKRPRSAIEIDRYRRSIVSAFETPLPDHTLEQLQGNVITSCWAGRSKSTARRPFVCQTVKKKLSLSNAHSPQQWGNENKCTGFCVGLLTGYFHACAPFNHWSVVFDVEGPSHVYVHCLLARPFNVFFDLTVGPSVRPFSRTRNGLSGWQIRRTCLPDRGGRRCHVGTSHDLVIWIWNLMNRREIAECTTLLTAAVATITIKDRRGRCDGRNGKLRYRQWLSDCNINRGMQHYPLRWELGTTSMLCLESIWRWTNYNCVLTFIYFFLFLFSFSCQLQRTKGNK
jgi:hypothetical protein